MSNRPIEHFEAASTLAVVVSSNEPLLFLSEDQRVIAASASFCLAFDIDPATVPGVRLGELGNGEWAMPTLVSLLKATASGKAQIEAYEIDLKRPDRSTRQLVVNARTLDDGNKDHVRLLLAVSDVTEARAETRLKDNLVRDNAILMQEVQHRVANSLQIIASVLMQSARRVQSEEVRGHLHNAHHRVMSIAALQRQLSAANGGNSRAPALSAAAFARARARCSPRRPTASPTVRVADTAVAADCVGPAWGCSCRPW